MGGIVAFGRGIFGVLFVAFGVTIGSGSVWLSDSFNPGAGKGMITNGGVRFMTGVSLGVSFIPSVVLSLVLLWMFGSSVWGIPGLVSFVVRFSSADEIVGGIVTSGFSEIVRLGVTSVVRRGATT